jgi:hypothetical protein
MPVTGNHDCYWLYEPAHNGGRGQPHSARTNDSWQHAFALPNNGEWYAYTYGNMRVINVFTALADWSGEFTDPFTYSFNGKTQETWLYEELASAHADADIRWILVNCHTAISGTGQIDYFRTRLTKIFKVHPVDLYVSGHTHGYFRMKTLNQECNIVIPDPMTKIDGNDHYDLSGNRMVHIVYAPGGEGPSALPDPLHPDVAVSKAERTFSIMEVNNRKITWTAYDINGNKFDKFTISK